MIYTGRGATISKDKRFRYHLWRQWSVNGGLFDPISCVFIMLNPSTADAMEDDPTIRRCVGFAQSFGCYRLDVVNLFAYRATDPDELISMSKAKYDAIGPENDDWILRVMDQPSKLVICAWGEAGLLCGRGDSIKAALIRRGVPLHALRISNSGMAGHPLYLPGNAPLLRYV